MWVVGSERKLSRGSETETGEEEEDGFVGAKERGSSLSLLLDMIWMGVEKMGFELEMRESGSWGRFYMVESEIWNGSESQGVAVEENGEILILG